MKFVRQRVKRSGGVNYNWDRWHLAGELPSHELAGWKPAVPVDDSAFYILNFSFLIVS